MAGHDNRDFETAKKAFNEKFADAGIKLEENKDGYDIVSLIGPNLERAYMQYVLIITTLMKLDRELFWSAIEEAVLISAGSSVDVDNDSYDDDDDNDDDVIIN